MNRFYLCIIANKIFPRNSDHAVIDCNALKQTPQQKCVVYATITRLLYNTKKMKKRTFK